MAIDLAGAKILIVDDTPANVDVLSIMLEAEKYKISAAPSGEVALRIAQKSPPDLILLDVMMPGMNGFQTCTELKKLDVTKDIPVVFVTAKTDVEAIVEAFEVGGEDYITKPIRKEEVLARVRHQLTLCILQREREKLVCELQEANAKIAREAEAKFAFFSGISHELRTPLGSIIGFSDFLQTHAKQDNWTQVNDFVKRINVAGMHMLRLVDNIMDFSKLDAGRMQLISGVVSLADVISEVEALLEPQLKSGGNQLQVSNKLVNEKFVTDRAKLFQILVNLLGNAAKFTRNGSISLRVEEIVQAGAPFISFTLQDTGIGMSPEQVQEIFSPFVQASADTAKQYGGTGLGLAICERYARLMGGVIEVESELNKGSCFILKIPATKPD